MDKREFLKGAVAMALTSAAPRPSNGILQSLPRTFIYKIADGCEVKADVYGSDLNTRKPVIIWIHGGALIFGSRLSPPEWLNLDGRYVVVSIDYRLAPETKLPAIIEDIQDAYKWTREQGKDLFHVDPERMGVAGQSAGGYLTLMAGFSTNPLPRVLLSLSGYGEITLPWYSRPSSFYLQWPLISKGDAYQSVGHRCVSTASQEGEHRERFYFYCRQQGVWPKQVTGHDPDAEPGWFDPYCPIRNVSAKYPPTLLIHGSADTDVPYEESVSMDEKLSRFNVKHEFLRVPGGSHCLVTDAPSVKASVFARAMDFVSEQLS